TKAIKKIRKLTSLPIAVYAQGNGIPEDNLGWKFFRKDKGAQYTKYAQQWIANGAQIIGGCCGTTPEYIYSISKILNQ
ncbi:MAG TPA: homocysteine S-methyltransferase family protein, partial [Patescibacteria group bacterium]